MSQFEQHLTVGKQYSLFAGFGMFCVGIWLGASVTESLVAGTLTGVFGLVSALAPDVDHQSSKPRQTVGRLSSILLLSCAVLAPVFVPELLSDVGESVAAVVDLRIDTQMLGTVTILGTTVIVIRIGGTLFDQLTTHRGMMHSPVLVLILFFLYYVFAGFVVGELQNIELSSAHLRELAAATGAGGVVVHLLEDR